MAPSHQPRSVIHRYHALKGMSEEQKSVAVPRVVFFGGKAAPGYFIAKLVIKLINSVAAVVNANESTNQWLKVVFIVDYNVSAAEIIIPASDISQVNLHPTTSRFLFNWLTNSFPAYFDGRHRGKVVDSPSFLIAATTAAPPT